MYLKLKDKIIPVHELTKFWERFKGLKFVFQKIDYGVKFPKRHGFTTNFLCQPVDIILTDKKEKIIKLYSNFKTEKYIIPRLKVYNVYLFPLGTAKNFKIGDHLSIQKEKEPNSK